MDSCPAPVRKYTEVLMAHGSGGLLTQSLIKDMFLPFLGNPALHTLDDAAMLPALQGVPVVSVDGFTVKPMYFPGGDIGSLAVSGSVNDVAMAGGHPKWLAVSFILEEGLPMAELQRAVESLARCAKEAGVAVVAGDTKVVARGEADGMYLSVTCLGEAVPRVAPYPQAPESGDVVIVSGPLARHGATIAAMQSLKTGQTPPDWLKSDAACLHAAAGALHQRLSSLRCMRDPTRGGLAAVLYEWAQRTGASFLMDESALPVREEEKAYCELLGLEPLQLASEGVLVAVVGKEEAAAALDMLHAHELTADAVACGVVSGTAGGEVQVRTLFGTLRYLDPPVGEIVPRIC